ncbi:NGG1p interacting factor 3-domain-containing protein [Obelidium mucronatum]|nr:NGG1p interacting factor 3-domain-containing protein [Obelidium mucronatum]
MILDRTLEEDEDKQRHGPVPEELNLLERVNHALFERIAHDGFTENPKTVVIVLETPTPRTDASKVLLVLDLTMKTVQEAINDPLIGVIMAYHPPNLPALQGITTADQTQHIRVRVESTIGIASGLTVKIRDKYRPILGLDGTYHYRMDRKVHPGTGAYFSLEQTKTVENLVMRLKKRVPLARVRLVLPPGTTASEKHIINIAVCAGSGYSVLTRWYPAQLYITGNMSHLELLEATSRGVVVILCENMEYCYLQKFKERLSAHITQGITGIAQR